jgi:hypothetical protein
VSAPLTRWLALAACHAAGDSALANHVAPVTMELADAYEMGRGVPRDYRRAAAIYLELCLATCDNSEACQRWYEMVAAFRGVAIVGRDYVRVAWAMCARGNPFACENGHMVPADLEPQIARCRAGAHDACEYASRHRGVELLVDACAAGMAKHCNEVFRFYTSDCAVRDRACVAGKIAALAPENARRLRLAYDTLVTRCDRGDAEACANLPGREVAKAARCDARDYHICFQLHDDARAHAVVCSAIPDCDSDDDHSLREAQLEMGAATGRCADGDALACETATRLVPGCRDSVLRDGVRTARPDR